MKKTLCLLLAVLLLASLSVTAFAVTDTDADSWTALQSGFEMHIPDVFREAKGAIIFREAGEGMQPGSGVVSATGIYIAMPLEEYEALIAEQKEAYEIEDMEKVFELGDLASLVEWNLFTVYGINRGRGEKELRSIVTERALNPDYFGEDEDLLKTVSEFYEHMEFREIGEKDSVRYYLCFWDPDEYLTLHELTGAAQVDSVYKDEFIAVSEQVKMLPDTVTLTGQAAFPQKVIRQVRMPPVYFHDGDHLRDHLSDLFRHASSPAFSSISLIMRFCSSSGSSSRSRRVMVDSLVSRILASHQSRLLCSSSLMRIFILFMVSPPI